VRCFRCGVRATRARALRGADRRALPEQLIRDETFVFEEDQRINREERYSDSSCNNKVLESIVKAHRSSSMRAHPKNPNWTIFEQSMSVSISAALGKTVQRQLESFAESIFLSAAKSGTVSLQQTLAELEAQRQAAENQANGGGVWWTGGSQNVPGAHVHAPHPPVPEDSSSGYFSETLDSWTNWMWPWHASSSQPAATTPARSMSMMGGVWWQDEEEADEWSAVGKSIVIEALDTGADTPALAHAAGVAGIAAASAGVHSAKDDWARPACGAQRRAGRDTYGERGWDSVGKRMSRQLAATRQGARKARRGLANMATNVARHAASPAVMLAGIAAQVVSAGADANAPIPTRLPATGAEENAKERRNVLRPKKLQRSISHPELSDNELLRRPEMPSFFFGRPLRQASPVGEQVERMAGVGASAAHVGAAAAFVSL
jgi:hypothetical protein